MRAPRGYVICTTPRTGSNFLCSILERTGVLGRPTEYFNTTARQKQYPDYPTDSAAQVTLIPTLGGTPNGVYGCKVMPFQADEAEEACWQTALPELRWIYLERTDILGQAVSWLRAYQTGQWRSKITEAEGEPRYDRSKIAIELSNILTGNARWNLFFALNDIEPLRLNYEAIAADPRPAVQAIADIMDVELPEGFTFESAERVQRDSLNAEWVERFKASLADIHRLPRLG